MLSLLREALDSPRCVLSVIGAHAGEGSEIIFGRKMVDCQTAGRTFWVAKSPKARPEQVQALCASDACYTIFIEPATQGGARPTVEANVATEFSVDRATWLPLPAGIGPVTGDMDKSAAALVLDQLTTDVGDRLDLWQYADAAAPDLPVRFALGLSTACALRKDMGVHPKHMKSRYRRILAVGRLTEPYCVWVR